MDMDYARRIPRLVAAVLDFIVILIIFAILSVANVIDPAAADAEEFDAVGSVIQAVIVLVYYVGLTTLLGQTLGKMAMGIKVVNADGEKPSAGPVLIRETIVRVLGTILSVVLGPAIGGPIGVLVFIIAIVWILFDDRRQGLHDKAAKTFVVKT